MNRLKLLIIWVFLVISISLEAQVIAFPNASTKPIWTTRYTLDLGGFGYDYIPITKDTQICGRTYGLLSVSSSSQLTFPFNLGFIRTEGKKVWIFKKDAQCSSKEYLLYDFGLNKGDTVYCGYFNTPLRGMPDTVKFWVNNIDSVLNQGRYIRRLRMNFISNLPCGTVGNPCPILKMDWLDGIGSTGSTFYSYSCFDCTQQVFLTCLQTSRGLQYLDPIYQSCPATTTAVSDIESEKIVIAPNPVFTMLSLKNSYQYIDSQLFITDLMGRVVKKVKAKAVQEIDVHDLPNGMYFLKIVSRGHSQTAKFEIMR